MKKALGTHILLELFDCNPNTLINTQYVKDAMVRAAESARANIVDTFSHQFKPYGVSGVVVIEESHLSVHTWPEYGYAAVDLFFCSEDVLPEKAKDVLCEAFEPRETKDVTVERGLREVVERYQGSSCSTCSS